MRQLSSEHWRAVKMVAVSVKRGQNLEAEAEVNFWRLRPRLRPKIIMKKSPNND